MGLHADIHHRDNEVNIALRGEFRSQEYDQLAAIVEHFVNRGCWQFVLDLGGISRMSEGAEESLRRLVEDKAVRPASDDEHLSAIRLMADNPAVRPQTGCGDLLLADVQPQFSPRRRRRAQAA
jgi:hypothetical protein